MDLELQVQGQDETLRRTQTEDTRQDTEGGRQAYQGSEVRWPIARLLGLIVKNQRPNSEPIASHN